MRPTQLIKPFSRFIAVLAAVFALFVPNLGWGQLTITSGSATAIACPSFPTPATTVSDIIFTENANNNFVNTGLTAGGGSGSTIIFCISGPFTFSSAGSVTFAAGDITSASVSLGGGQITVTVASSESNAGNEIDILTLSGIQVVATGSGTGTIFRCNPSGGTQAVNGLGVGTTVANLSTSSGTPATISLSSGAGTNNQTLCQNTAGPSPLITFAVGGGATGATVSGLPAGMSGSYSAGTFTISGTPTAAPGSYPYTVTTTGMAPCAAVTATGTITVITPISALSYSTPVTYCAGSAITNNSPTVTGGGTITYSVSPALPTGLSLNTATGVISGTPTTATVAANYTVTATNGCSSRNATVNITVVSAPTTSTNGGNQTLASCATTATLTGNIPTSGTGTWTVSSVPAQAAPTFSNINLGTSTVSGLVPGTVYTFTWTIANAPCTPSSASSFTVTTVVGPGCNTYCTPAPTDATATYTNINNVTVSDLNVNTGDAATPYFNLTGNVGTVIAGTTYPISVTADPDCDGFPGCAIISTCVTVFVDWNGDGDFGDGNEITGLGSVTAINQTVSGSLIVPAGAFPGANLLMRIVLSGDDVCPHANPCVFAAEAQVQDFSIYVLQCLMNTPAISTATQTLAACDNDITMTANAITNGTGSWSITSGSGTIVSPTATTTNVTDLGAGANTFVWVATPTVSGCPVLTSAAVTITTVNLPSVAYAGPDAGSCSTTQTMAATVPTSGTGTWSHVSGCPGATITSPNSATSTISSLCTGTSIWQWTVVNAACPLLSTSDQVEITVAASVTPASAGPDQTGICWNASALGLTTLAGNTPVVGTGAWTINSNTTGGALSSTTDPTADITGINATGSITLTWTISSPGCSNSTDQVTITTQNCNGDEPCTALGLAVNSGTCSFSTYTTLGTMNISTGMPEPACAAINGPDMWFTVTVPPSGQVQISANTTGTAFDEMITIYDGTCGNLEFNGCVDGAGTDVYPLTYAGVPGSTIWVRVNEGGTGDATTGSFQICAYEATTATVSEVLPGVTTTVTCGQTLNFYDPGGEGGTTTTNTSQPPPAGNYTNNTGTTWTICPSDPTQYVRIVFNEFTIENGFDKMIITSGADDVIAQWTANDGQGDVVTSQNPGECLTIYFQSDYIWTAEGWEAVVSCTNTPVASQINTESSVNNCVGDGGVWVCADGTYNTEAGSGAGIDEINEVTGGCWGAAGEVATSWFYFTTASAGTLEFFFDPSNNGHNLNFALYGPSLDGQPPCPTLTGDAPIRCSFTDQGGANTGMSSANSDAYDGPFGNSFSSPLTVADNETYALVVDVYQNGQPPTQTTIDFTGALTLDCTVLPIDLVNFSGINQGRSNLLSWLVASQVINDYFTIERSVNGTFWEIVGTVDGAGTTQTPMFYSLDDENPYFPVTYYRLKQTDYDGKFKYSDLITVTNNKNLDADFIGLLAPNPTSDFATFSYEGNDTKSPLNVAIINQMGAIVQNFNHVNLHKGMAMTIRTNEMAEGLYQVIFTQGDQRQVQRLSIVRN